MAGEPPAAAASSIRSARSAAAAARPGPRPMDCGAVVDHHRKDSLHSTDNGNLEGQEEAAEAVVAGRPDAGLGSRKHLSECRESQFVNGQ